MLQVARLAPRQLGESRDLVASFLRGSLNDDGGFRNRSGESDLYYTVFGLEGLVALQEPVPADVVAAFLSRFGDGEGLDLVHLASLARCWSLVSRHRTGVPAAGILERLARFRAHDGGYAQAPGASESTVYASFLAFGAHQDLGAEVPDPARVLAALGRLRARDGGYANRAEDAFGITTVTAAAVMLYRALDHPVEPHLGMWLLDRCHASGGFLAAPAAPIPDLLSTATALHALAALHAPLAGVQDACLDFVDSLWTNRGGFYGTWADDVLDCEYTYYGLLALGHLTLAAPE
jgi:hypothetical protein